MAETAWTGRSWTAFGFVFLHLIGIPVGLRPVFVSQAGSAGVDAFLYDIRVCSGFCIPDSGLLHNFLHNFLKEYALHRRNRLVRHSSHFEERPRHNFPPYTPSLCVPCMCIGCRRWTGKCVVRQKSKRESIVHSEFLHNSHHVVRNSPIYNVNAL